jgi:hypothetical protein
VVLKVIEQLRSDEKVLACMFGASNVDHAGVNESAGWMLVSTGLKQNRWVYEPLIAWIHALVDLVNDAERRSGQTLQRHEVEDGRHSAFTT